MNQSPKGKANVRRSAGRRVTAHAVEERRIEAIGELVRGCTGPKPRVGPVRCGEKEQRRRCDVEVDTQLALLDACPEQLADARFVAPALRKEFFLPGARKI